MNSGRQGLSGGVHFFIFIFRSTRVPLGLNKLWLPGQERKRAKAENKYYK